MVTAVDAWPFSIASAHATPLSATSDAATLFSIDSDDATPLRMTNDIIEDNYIDDNFII